MTKINVIDVVTDNATRSSLSDVESDMASDVAANMAANMAFFQSAWPNCYLGLLWHIKIQLFSELKFGPSKFNNSSPFLKLSLQPTKTSYNAHTKRIVIFLTHQIEQ